MPFNFLTFFFFKILYLWNWVIYQSIELDLLYKTIYMTFLSTLEIESKKSKYSAWVHFKILVIFQYFDEMYRSINDSKKILYYFVAHLILHRIIYGTLFQNVLELHLMIDEDRSISIILLYHLQINADFIKFHFCFR